MRRKSNETTLKDAIDRLLKVYKLEDKMREVEVLKSWEELMGRAVAARTKEIYIDNQILYVKMESAVMRDELSREKSMILRKINEKAGKELIKDVWFG
jgi:predicted nucleic acid-binding Zn ribbon protein